MALRRCEFYLVRYVPNPVRNEFVNIGVMVRDLDDFSATAVQFTRDWTRVRCMDGEADLAILEEFESELRRLFPLHIEDVSNILQVMQDSFSNALQLTPAKPCYADSLETELEKLMRMHVDSDGLGARGSERQAIHTSMRVEFEKIGLWDLMRKRIAVEIYTEEGDSLVIDCGYRHQDTIRMFHAVPLYGGSSHVKGLAFSMSPLRKGVLELLGADLDFTAIVEAPSALRAGVEVGATARYRFGIRTLEDASIRVVPSSGLTSLAEELRATLPPIG